MAATFDFTKLGEAALAVPKPKDTVLSYGTAGFRAEASILDSTFLRMGVLAALRAWQKKQIIGLMITASHNPAPDNGVKMMDPDGGMLAPAWEAHAQGFANVEDGDVVAAVQAIIAKEGIDMSGDAPRVYIARDTRPSSEHLSALVQRGAEAVGAVVTDNGLLTTPQLHHIVRMTNFAEAGGDENVSKEQYEAWASEEGYYRMLAEEYRAILGSTSADKAGRGPVIIDGACGVGARKLVFTADAVKDLLDIEIRNNPEDGELNHECGAEHAQKQRLPPRGFDPAADKLKRLASVDGDADRLVYHYFDSEGQWQLLDGDAISAIAAVFLREQFDALNIAVDGSDGGVDLGIVQTAYANGASSAYIRDTLKMPLQLAKTGVKFVHHKAEGFELGVYFEANGHGTVLFSKKLLDRLYAMRKSEAELSAAAREALNRLIAASRLINQAVGDAMSDAMFVEAVLTLKGWTLQDWNKLYSDLPSKQDKLAVADRTMFKPTDDETKLIEPAALQSKIDEFVAAVPCGRAFVRPSGTENVVRLYAEAETSEQANELAAKIMQAIKYLGFA